MNKETELNLLKWKEHDKPILQITSEGKLIITEGATAPDVAQVIADAFESTEASKMRQLQAEIERLREENAKLREAEWYYDPKDPECGSEDSLIFTEEENWGSAVQLHGARTVTTNWHILIPKTFDDNGDVDDYEEESFATEQEALEAYEAALQHNEEL